MIANQFKLNGLRRSVNSPKRAVCSLLPRFLALFGGPCRGLATAANLACCEGCACRPPEFVGPRTEARRPEQFVELAPQIERRAGREAYDCSHGVEPRAAGPAISPGMTGYRADRLLVTECPWRPRRSSSVATTVAYRIERQDIFFLESLGPCVGQCSNDNLGEFY
jgi:hypothetical protein